jgi:hypothetical protein
MRPDGQGTDERDPPGLRQPQSANSLERDVLRLALAVALLAIIGLGALYLSKRAHLPDMSGASDSTLRQTP